MTEASRPKTPPSDREIVQAREKGYQFYSDLATEQALRWSLSKHPHSLDRVYAACPWCRIERCVLAKGHMASVRPAPAWWKRFIAQIQNERGAISKIKGGYGWALFRVEGPDGKWWVLNPIDFLRGRSPRSIRALSVVNLGSQPHRDGRPPRTANAAIVRPLKGKP